MTKDSERLPAGAENPPENTLPPGMSAEQVERAVIKSGYPLQSIVASELKKSFTAVREEWRYIDRVTEEQRALDVFCYQSLGNERASGVVPAFIMLVECKRSELPYIFFRSAVGARAEEFPRILGLPYRSFSLKNRAGAGRQVSLAEAMKLVDHPFVASGPPVCTGVSHTARRGKNLALSGTQPFRRIVLPLVSAFEHATKYYAPVGSDAKRYHADLVICLGVIDAPMLLADSNPSSPALYLNPWTRLVYHEVSLKKTGHKRETCIPTPLPVAPKAPAQSSIFDMEQGDGT